MQKVLLEYIYIYIYMFGEMKIIFDRKKVQEKCHPIN